MVVGSFGGTRQGARCICVCVCACDSNCASRTRLEVSQLPLTQCSRLFSSNDVTETVDFVRRVISYFQCVFLFSVF